MWKSGGYEMQAKLFYFTENYKELQGFLKNLPVWPKSQKIYQNLGISNSNHN